MASRAAGFPKSVRSGKYISISKKVMSKMTAQRPAINKLNGLTGRWVWSQAWVALLSQSNGAGAFVASSGNNARKLVSPTYITDTPGCAI